MSYTSDLKLTRIDTGDEIVLPAGGDYGISQSLEPLDAAADIRRDVNGGLIVVENTLFRKFNVEISGQNFAPPAISGLWRGARVRVESAVQTTPHTVISGVAELIRDPVPESIDARTSDGRKTNSTLNGRTVGAPGASYVFYRPIIDCVVMSISYEAEEDRAEVSWSLELEEE